MAALNTVVENDLSKKENENDKDAKGNNDNKETLENKSSLDLLMNSYCKGTEVLKIIKQHPEYLKLLIDSPSKFAQLNYARYLIFVLGDAKTQDQIKANQAKGIEILNKWVQAGEAEATYIYGAAHAQGLGVKKDIKMALKLYITVRLYPAARRQLASLHYEGIGVLKDLNRAFQEYCELSELGDSDSIVNLGYCYQTGHGVPDSKRDMAKAIQLYELAKSKNNSNACAMLGDIFEKGLQDETNKLPDFIKAFMYYEQGAQNENAVCLYKLVDIYSNGLGDFIQINIPKAIEYGKRLMFHTEESIIQLFNLASQLLDNNLENQTEIQKNKLVIARLLFLEIIRKENKVKAAAYRQLARIFAMGSGIESNREVAFNYADISAELGDALGHSVLASFYHDDGACAENDGFKEKANTCYHKAFQSYSYAVDKGYNEAIPFLAECYEKGRGVEQDLKKAFELYEAIGNHSTLGPDARKALIRIQMKQRTEVRNDIDAIVSLSSGNLRNPVSNHKNSNENEIEAESFLPGLNTRNRGFASEKMGVVKNDLGALEKALSLYIEAIEEGYYAADRDMIRVEQLILTIRTNTEEKEKEKTQSQVPVQAKANARSTAPTVEKKEISEAHSLRTLGMNYFLGKEVPKNLKTAFEYFSKAVQLGDNDAIYFQGKCYGRGDESFPRDPKKAFECYENAKTKNSILGWMTVADIYAYGYKEKDFEIPADVNKAAQYYLEIIQAHINEKLGDTVLPRLDVILVRELCNKLIAIEPSGVLLVELCKKMIENPTRFNSHQMKITQAMLENASEKGCACAILPLSHCYEHGIGTAADLEKAYSLLRTSVDYDKSSEIRERAERIAAKRLKVAARQRDDFSAYPMLLSHAQPKPYLEPNSNLTPTSDPKPKLDLTPQSDPKPESTPNPGVSYYERGQNYEKGEGGLGKPDLKRAFECYQASVDAGNFEALEAFHRVRELIEQQNPKQSPLLHGTVLRVGSSARQRRVD